jgi:plastocyanin
MATKRVFVVSAACAFLGLMVASSSILAEAQEDQTAVSAKGRIAGGQHLLNPVWNEAKDPKNHRYTFRMPSTTVNKNAIKLSAYLPKELTVVALSADAAPTKSTPYPVHVSGGRTTPVTVVVSAGQNVQFINDDPFTHKLYSTKESGGKLGPEATRTGQQRTWQPPGVGVYEVRDENFPSLRTWVVVEPRAAGVGYPNFKNEFIVADLMPGAYELQAYFSGKPVGDPLKITLRPGPDVQQIPQPLKVGKSAKKKADDKGEDKKKD